MAAAETRQATPYLVNTGDPDATKDGKTSVTLAAAQNLKPATNSSGNWTAAVTPGTTVADVQKSDLQYPTVYTQTEGNDPTTFTAVASSSFSGGTAGYFLPSSITGSVLALLGGCICLIRRRKQE